MTGINLSLGQLFKIWWAIQWRGALVSLLFFAVCYSLWQAFPWPALLVTWAPNLSIHAIAVLAAALIGIPFGLLTVRWFLSACLSDLQILTESQESHEPPRFRIEPRIGNIAHAGFHAKSISLDGAVATARETKVQNYPLSPKAQQPKAKIDHRAGHAGPH
jgi:hypothetical protein